MEPKFNLSKMPIKKEPVDEFNEDGVIKEATPESVTKIVRRPTFSRETSFVPRAASPTFRDSEASPANSSMSPTTSERLFRLGSQCSVASEKADSFQSNSETTCDISQLASEISRLRKELSQERLDHEKTRNLLQTSSDELQTAGYFLNQTDSLSYADVAVLAKDLNHHIFELAAGMVDKAVSKYESHTKDKRGMIITRVRNARVGVTATKAVGRGFFDLVERLSSGSDQVLHRTTLMQYTIQSWLVLFCYNFLEKSRWSNDQGEERVLRKVYERFLVGEQKHHTLAGRWRTLTREVCRLAATQVSVDQLTKQVLAGLKPVLAAFGFGLSPKDASTFMFKFRGSANSVMSSLLQIDLATKERVSTVDILPFMGSPGTRFNGELMEDGNASSSRPSNAQNGDTVLVPTGLGFTWTKRENRRSTSECLVKPQVVLSAAFVAEG